MEISRKDEVEQILKRVVVRVKGKLPCDVLLDRSFIDEETRPFEVFDVFFSLPAACDGGISSDSADGMQLIHDLAGEATDLIVERFQQLLPGFEGPITVVGISDQLEWWMGAEAVEAEAMLGDLWDRTAIPVQMRFYARFLAPVEQMAGRCFTAPPPVPALPRPAYLHPSAEEQLDYDGSESDPPIEWFRQA